VPAQDPSTEQDGGAVHRERLWPAWWVWVVAAGMGASAGLVAVRLAGPAVVVAVAVAVTAVLCWGLVATTARVEVAGGHLVAGAARLPLEVVGGARALTSEETRHALGPGLDARAYLCIRGWVPQVVRVDLADPHDPTPCWLVSSRRPQALAAAVTAAASAVRRRS
jgi:Protein of unknown function (DUF3093)